MKQQSADEFKRCLHTQMSNSITECQNKTKLGVQ